MPDYFGRYDTDHNGWYDQGEIDRIQLDYGSYPGQLDGPPIDDGRDYDDGHRSSDYLDEYYRNYEEMKARSYADLDDSDDDFDDDYDIPKKKKKKSSGGSRKRTKVKVSGLQYNNYEALWQEWLEKPSKGIILRREPENEFDSNAVAVYIHENLAGYLCCKDAEKIAPLMDAGKTVDPYVEPWIKTGKNGGKYIELQLEIS